MRVTGSNPVIRLNGTPPASVEPPARVDWQAIAEHRERELREAGQARYAAEVDRDRARRDRAAVEARLRRTDQRVDQLHQAITAAEHTRDRYRRQLDLANTERLQLAAELAAAQDMARQAETRLRRRIGIDLRNMNLIDLFAALITAADPAVATPTSRRLADVVLGALADQIAGPEPAIGVRPAGRGSQPRQEVAARPVAVSRRPWWRRLLRPHAN